MDMIQKWAQEKPQQIALITSLKTYSWKALDDTISELCHQLTLQNLCQGSVVALISKNEPKAVLLYLACLRLGALCALMPPQPLQSIKQKLIIIQADYCWLGESTLDVEPSILCPLLSFDLDNTSFCTGFERREIFCGEQQASIIFTSGSTGTPKAVVHCVKHHLASAQGLTEAFKFEHNDSWLLSLPIYHVSGLSILWRWLCKGAKLVIGEDLLHDLQHVTHASLVPTQLQRLLDQPYDVTLKRVLLGGGHIPLSLTQRASDKGIECWVGYGMTETASTVIAKQVDGFPTSGALLPYRKIKVEGAKIFVAGDTLALGYLSEGKLTPLISSQTPWFDTKDLGRVHFIENKADEIEILGREDNQFISGGENIHCEEIEAVLNRHPNIKQAIVIPISNVQYGHRPIAFIDGVIELSNEEYKQFLVQYLDKFKCPDAYYLLPENLMNTGIKIARVDLKRYYQQHYGGERYTDKP